MLGKPTATYSVIDIEAGTKLVTIGVLAEAAQAAVERCHVAASLSNVGSDVALTRLAWGCLELCKFVLVALYGHAVDYRAQQTFQQILERREPVHPSFPEAVEFSQLSTTRGI